MRILYADESMFSKIKTGELQWTRAPCIFVTASEIIAAHPVFVVGWDIVKILTNIWNTLFAMLHTRGLWFYYNPDVCGRLLLCSKRRSCSTSSCSGIIRIVSENQGNSVTMAWHLNNPRKPRMTIFEFADTLPSSRSSNKANTCNETAGLFEN